jgi:hypothetical protein
MRFVLALIFCAGCCFQACSQKQLLLLKRGKIIHVYQPGETIRLKMKGDDNITRSYVNNILEYAVVLHQDTIPFIKIERLYISEPSVINKIGGMLTVGGGGLFAIDQVNQLIQGNGLNLDQDISTVSLVSVGVGLPMMLIRKKSQKLRYPYKLFMVKQGDPLYQR